MFGAKGCSVLTAALLLAWSASAFASRGQSPSPTATPARPPAPVLVSPANGASVVQPITLDWNPVSAPGGPIGSYTWEVGTTNTFTTVIASGFTNMDPDPSIPTPTADKVSGLPNGTYFWRVKATQLGLMEGSIRCGPQCAVLLLPASASRRPHLCSLRQQAPRVFTWPNFSTSNGRR